jgi:hypothetical protein
VVHMSVPPSSRQPWWGRLSPMGLVLIVAGYANNRRISESELPDGQLMINDGGGWKETE